MASPIVSQNKWFLERRSDVIPWRLLIGRHISCAVRSEDSIGRGFDAFRIHGNGQMADENERIYSTTDIETVHFGISTSISLGLESWCLCQKTSERAFCQENRQSAL